MEYMVTAEKEVLIEVAAGIEAAIFKFLDSKNISYNSESNEPMILLLNMVADLSDSLIENPDYTMEDVKKIGAQFAFAKEYTNKVVSANA